MFSGNDYNRVFRPFSLTVLGSRLIAVVCYLWVKDGNTEIHTANNYCSFTRNKRFL